MGGVREGEVQGKPIVVSDIEPMKKKVIYAGGAWRVGRYFILQLARSKSKPKKRKKTPSPVFCICVDAGSKNVVTSTHVPKWQP